MVRKRTPARSDPAACGRQFTAARRAGTKAARTEPAAAFAACHPPDRGVDVRLGNGTCFRFRVERIPELAPLANAARSAVKVTAFGRGLRRDGADVHLSVPHLMDSACP